MKGGTFYARRVKRALASWKKQSDVPRVPAPSDPVDQLVIGLLGDQSTMKNAVKAAKALLDAMVDYNEVRVSTRAEIAAVIRAFVPEAGKRGEAVRSALNAVFRKQHGMHLRSLEKMGLREARQYLESLDGMDAHAAASVILWSLGGHAIPVSKPLYEMLVAKELVEPTATVHEVQAFLERNISAADAREFCLLAEMQLDSGSVSPRAKKSDSRRSDDTKPAARRSARTKSPTKSLTGKRTDQRKKKAQL